MLLAYAIYRMDPVFILGQATGLIIYARNIYFIWLGKRDPSAAKVERVEGQPHPALQSAPLVIRSAPSPSGKAEVCKTSIPGSNPGGASNFSFVNMRF